MQSHVLSVAKFRESALMAMAAIRSSKLRSVLTMLGIVVGIFSIISVMTALSVLRNSIEQGMTQLGANTFQVQKFSMDFNTTPEQRRKMWNRKNITFEQAVQVRDRATLADAVGIEGSTQGKMLFWEGKKTNPNITMYGEMLEGQVTNDWTVASGRGLVQQDLDLSRPVMVLGSAVVEKLFPPYIDPVGQTIRTDEGIFQVVGVYAKKGSSLGGNQDNFVVIPLPTYFEKFGRTNQSLHIMVKALNQDVMDDAIEQVRGILRTARKVTPGTDDDFSFFSNDSLIKQFNDFTVYLRMGVLVVSCIALLAAGIGIMNIMLVSVTERTREIGIRKSVGAQRSDILSQFMIEAVILCEIGGAVGVLLGIAGGNVVSVLTNSPAVIPWDWVVIGLVTCSLVGFVFGVYPAWKAAHLDPIEALRYE
ncbi:MAG TPA: ABC transporter permease [Bacteroidota bacterium]|nr:ABC transporter permease [Bacteroidota bacterium]